MKEKSAPASHPTPQVPAIFFSMNTFFFSASNRLPMWVFSFPTPRALALSLLSASQSQFEIKVHSPRLTQSVKINQGCVSRILCVAINPWDPRCAPCAPCFKCWVNALYCRCVCVRALKVWPLWRRQILQSQIGACDFSYNPALPPSVALLYWTHYPNWLLIHRGFFFDRDFFYLIFFRCCLWCVRPIVCCVDLCIAVKFLALIVQLHWFRQWKEVH